MNNGMAYRASVCRWLLAQVKLTWASPWQQLLRLPAGRYPTNLYFAADLTFSPSPSLCLSPSPFPSLSFSCSHTQTHIYTLFFLLPPSFFLSHSFRNMSLPRSLSRASPSSLLLPSPSYDFYPCFTILFVSTAKGKDRLWKQARRISPQ